MNYRPNKEKYYLNIAREISIRSTCMVLQVGAILVKDDQIIATGYNGAPRKTMDCQERGECLRRKLNIPSGHRYELCRSMHGEMNAIINAARAGVSLLESDMYIYAKRVWQKEEQETNAYPCFICKKMIINSGIKRVIGCSTKGDLRIFNVTDWVGDWQERDMLDDMDEHKNNYQK